QPEDGLSGAWSDLVATWPAARSSAPFDPTVRTDPSTPLGPLVDWAARLREQLRVAGPLQSRLDAVSESQTKILRTENCETQVELEQRLASEESALGVVVRELAALENEETLIGTLRTEGANELDAILARERSEESADQEREEALENRIRELHRKKAGFEGEPTPNVAAVEIEAQDVEREMEEVTRERDALALAYRWMDEALESYQQTHREQLAARITEHFRTFTGLARRVELDERFELSIVEPSGHPLCLEQLSQGARDQLLLAVRLGVADLLAASVPLPFFFDDPFLHFDRQRAETVRQALARLGEDRPWVLLTHRAEMAEWADPVFTEELEAVPSLPGSLPTAGEPTPRHGPATL
ncbi:MAG: hypothetical protein KC729_08400, partial [Candidatus Eisenbacteria bacterium]|nr:hypothetical protein [Candidatus Eisenbacteria bacterium]